MQKLDETNQQQYSVFRGKTNYTVFTNFNIFCSKIGKKLRQNTENVNNNNKNQQTFHKILNLDNSVDKTKFEIIFPVLYSTLDGCLMIPITTLYDEYIDRPKLIEQKNPFEYTILFKTD